MDFLTELESTSWSRNWEEEEEDESFIKPEESPVFSWKETHKKEYVDTLLIGLRGAGASFLDCTFPQKSHSADLFFKRATETCKIYFPNDSSSTLLALCHDKILPEQSLIWTSCLFEHIKSKKVIIFDGLLDTRYSTSYGMDPHPPMLYKLQTNTIHKGEYDFCSFLDVPNLIDGIVAAILSHCELNNLPCIAFLSLEEAQLLNAPTLQAFEPIVRTLFNIPQQSPSQYYNAIEKTSLEEK